MIDKFQSGHGHEDSFQMPEYVLNISAGDKISTCGGLSPLCRSQEISPAGATYSKSRSPPSAGMPHRWALLSPDTLAGISKALCSGL